MKTVTTRFLYLLTLAALCMPLQATAQVCLPAGEVCTADDLSTKTIALLPSSPDIICTGPTDDVTVDLQAQMQPNASSRYDVAVLVSTDGDPVIGNGTDCSAHMLDNLESGGSPFDGISGVGPYREEDGDLCGDANSTDGVIVYNLPQLTLPCTDVDNDSFVDISTAFLWTQSAQGGQSINCQSVNDLAAGTTAKCFVEAINIPIDTGGTLPVELASFAVTLEDRTALLAWTTLSEQENAGFDVEHARPGEGFVPVGFVEGAGTTTEPQNYQYTINDLIPGRHVFRLKQIDSDGTFIYTFAVEATVDLPEGYFLSDAYPNPFNPQAVIDFAVAQTQPVTVGLYNINGQLVRHLYHGVPEGGQNQNVRIDGTGLSSGVYMVRLEGQDFQASRQVVLSK